MKQGYKITSGELWSFSPVAPISVKNMIEYNLN